MNDDIPVETRWGRSSASMELPAPIGLVPHLVPRLVSRSGRFTVQSLDAQSAVLSCAPNRRTWGARLTVTFSPSSPSSSTLHARWEPELKTTLLTWGQGKKDIHELFGLIAGEASQATPHK